MKGKLEEVDDIDYKLKKAKLLNINLKNWRELKIYGCDFDTATKLIYGQTEIDEPKMRVTNNNQIQTGSGMYGLVNNLCTLCDHTHSTYEPRVCVHASCNCGIRG